MKTGCIVFLFLCFEFFVWAGDNKWTSNGPFGGNFSTITIHPQTAGLVLAGGESVVRTTNNGSQWTSINLGKDVVVRVNPKDPNMLVAAHSTVFQSNDRGNTWKLVSNNKFLGDSLIDFEFNPTTPSILYGVTFDHGVFKSQDGGKTWQAKNSGLSFKHCNECYDTPRLEVDPTNGNTVYVLLPSRKVFKSTNGGDSWQSASSGLTFTNSVAVLAIDPSNPQILYAGGDDGVFKTVNGAGSWASANCHCQATDIAVDAASPQNVYVAYLGIIKSADSGKTWKAVHIPPPSFYLSSVAALRNQIFVGSYGGGLYRSLNGGGSWVPVNNGANSLNAAYLTATAQKSGLMFAEGNGILFKTINGGGLWQLVNGAAALSLNEVKIHPQNPNLVVAAGCCCAPAISTNGGTSWRCNTSIQFSSYQVALDPKSQQVLYLASPDQGVAKSTDQGHAVRVVNSGLADTAVTSIAINPSDSNTLLVGTNSGKVFKTTNGASSWTSSSSGLGIGPIISISYDPKNANIVYCLTDYQGKGVYKSTNGGQSWVLKSKGLPTGQTSLTIHPTNPSILFTGGYGGAFISTDGAESWSLFDTNGLGPFVVLNFLVNPSDPNTYLAATQWGVYSYKRTVTPSGPSIDRVSPAAAKPGSVVTISGNNFGPTQGNSKVSFGNLSAGTAVSWSNSSIQLRVPSGAATSPLSVVVASTSSNPYGFVAPATTGKITPTSGSMSGGNTITLTLNGSFSAALTQQLLVLLGGVVLNDCHTVPPNYLVCTTPAAPPGTTTVDVQVLLNQLLTLLGSFSYGG